MSYSESQVKSIASQRWLKQRQRKIGLSILMCVGWDIVLYYMHSNLKIWYWIAPWVLIVVLYGFSWYQARKDLLVKYKEDPSILE